MGVAHWLQEEEVKVKLELHLPLQGNVKSDPLGSPEHSCMYTMGEQMFGAKNCYCTSRERQKHLPFPFPPPEPNTDGDRSREARGGGTKRADTVPLPSLSSQTKA